MKVYIVVEYAEEYTYIVSVFNNEDNAIKAANEYNSKYNQIRFNVEIREVVD